MRLSSDKVITNHLSLIKVMVESSFPPSQSLIYLLIGTIKELIHVKYPLEIDTLIRISSLKLFIFIQQVPIHFLLPIYDFLLLLQL